MQIILSTIAGFILGTVFCWFNLPIPAPPNFAGLMGLVGIYLGYVVVNGFF